LFHVYIRGGREVWSDKRRLLRDQESAEVLPFCERGV